MTGASSSCSTANWVFCPTSCLMSSMKGSAACRRPRGEALRLASSYRRNPKHTSPSASRASSPWDISASKASRIRTRRSSIEAPLGELAMEPTLVLSVGFICEIDLVGQRILRLEVEVLDRYVCSLLW